MFELLFVQATYALTDGSREVKVFETRCALGPSTCTYMGSDEYATALCCSPLHLLLQIGEGNRLICEQ